MIPPQCQTSILGPALTVWWLNGLESFVLWAYNPTTNIYSPITPGLDAGRASVVAGPTTQFSIMGNAVLQGGSDGSVQAIGLQEYGGTGGGPQPQLQFFIGNVRVAALSTASLKVKLITEAAPAPGNLFKIFANGSLAGTMSAAGLIATEAEEGGQFFP